MNPMQAFRPRRRGLLLALAGSLLGGLPRGAVALPAQSVAGLATRVLSAGPAAAIGAARLAGLHTLPALDDLDASLRQRLGWPEAGRSPAHFAAALDRRIRDDFAARRLTHVDGWVLSETEADLYHLIARSAQG